MEIKTNDHEQLFDLVDNHIKVIKELKLMVHSKQLLIDALRDKLGREIQAHRENVDRMHAAERARDEMARFFMDLHDAAKQYVGPKLTAPTKEF